MPKKIDPKVKERCVRQMLEHQAEYSSLTAAAAAVRKMSSSLRHVSLRGLYEGLR